MSFPGEETWTEANVGQEWLVLESYLVWWDKSSQQSTSRAEKQPLPEPPDTWVRGFRKSKVASIIKKHLGIMLHQLSSWPWTRAHLTPCLSSPTQAIELSNACEYHTVAKNKLCHWPHRVWLILNLPWICSMISKENGQAVWCCPIGNGNLGYSWHPTSESTSHWILTGH